MKTLLTPLQIVQTYDQRQQEQCRLFDAYRKVSKENPAFGYKRIAKLLGEKSSKTRWWHAGKHTPVPVQTVEWLKKKGLLPLTDENPKLKLITKILGTTFGDGGIFANLNAIFLSSSELEAVNEFKEDLMKIFGKEIEPNFELREGGIEGHSWCMWSTNRNVIRFFVALGGPVGDKSKIELKIPSWVKELSRESIENEFFGSIFGNEMCIPKVHIGGTHLDSLAIGITGKEEFALNRKEFLLEMAIYLNKKEVKTGTISVNDHKKVNREGIPTKIYKLLIGIEFENVVNFMTLTKMNYCKYKQDKLGKTMNEFAAIKRKRYFELEERGYKEEAILNLLNLNEAMWYVITNYEDFSKIYEEELGSELIVPEFIY